MPLPFTGPLSISQIKTELGSSSNSLRTLSSTAGFSTPDAMNEFFGYPFVSGAVLFLDANNANSYGGSGTTWSDISGNGNNFTMASYNGGSNPVFTTAGSLKYFQFTGTTAPAAAFLGGGYMTRGASINMDYSTTTVWFNNNTSSPKVMILGSTGWESSVFQGVEFFLNGAAIGQMSTRITTGGGTSNSDINSPYNYNQWYQLTQTFDGTTQSMYINGTIYSSVSKSGVQNRPNRNYLIGAHQGGDGNPAVFMNGAIAQYVIYNRAFSSTEVQRNFNAQKSLYGY
jgi:hypothetical protein